MFLVISQVTGLEKCFFFFPQEENKERIFSSHLWVLHDMGKHEYSAEFLPVVRVSF